MASELDWTLAYSYLANDASAEEIEDLANSFAKLACHSCVHANVCTRSEGPDFICSEFMLVSDCEKVAA